MSQSVCRGFLFFTVGFSEYGAVSECVNLSIN